MQSRGTQTFTSVSLNIGTDVNLVVAQKKSCFLTDKLHLKRVGMGGGVPVAAQRLSFSSEEHVRAAEGAAGPGRCSTVRLRGGPRCAKSGAPRWVPGATPLSKRAPLLLSMVWWPHELGKTSSMTWTKHQCHHFQEEKEKSGCHQPLRAQVTAQECTAQGQSHCPPLVSGPGLSYLDESPRKRPLLKAAHILQTAAPGVPQEDNHRLLGFAK